MYKETRCAKTVNLLSKLGVSVTYDRVLDIESAMAIAVVHKMAVNGVFMFLLN